MLLDASQRSPIEAYVTSLSLDPTPFETKFDEHLKANGTSEGFSGEIIFGEPTVKALQTLTTDLVDDDDTTSKSTVDLSAC